MHMHLNFISQSLKLINKVVDHNVLPISIKRYIEISGTFGPPTLFTERLIDKISDVCDLCAITIQVHISQQVMVSFDIKKT